MREIPTRIAPAPLRAIGIERVTFHPLGARVPALGQGLFLFFRDALLERFGTRRMEKRNVR